MKTTLTEYEVLLATFFISVASKSVSGGLHDLVHLDWLV